MVDSPHPMDTEAPVLDPHETVSITDTAGRVLEGTGVPEEQLVETGLRPEKQPEDKPVSRAQKRITELTSKADKAEAARLATEQKALELANRLAILEAAEAARQTKQPEPEPAQTGRPKPAVSEIGSKYPDYESYVEDLADWKAEQREAKLREEFDARFEQRIEAERASRTQQSQSDTVLSRGRAAYADFDAVLQACPVAFPEGMLKAILSLPQAEHVEYALAKDPELAERIAKIPDGLTLGIELAKLMPGTGRVTPASRPVPVRSSQAPPPIEPVGAGSSTTSPPLADVAESGNYAAYKAARSAHFAAIGGVTRR